MSRNRKEFTDKLQGSLLISFQSKEINIVAKTPLKLLLPIENEKKILIFKENFLLLSKHKNVMPQFS